MAGPLSISALHHAVNTNNIEQITKTSPSRFDAALEKAKEINTNKVQETTNIQPVTTSKLTDIISSIENGTKKVDAIIKSSLSNKNMSNAELLQMQAVIYKYSQELDLCSKVVDKATNGLRDVLKTQV